MLINFESIQGGRMQKGKDEHSLTTSSVLHCPDNLRDNCTNIRWLRDTSQGIQVLKNEERPTKEAFSYQCTIFDYDTVIRTEVCHLNGSKTQLQFGPISLDYLIKKQLQKSDTLTPSFKVKLLTSNKKDNPITVRVVNDQTSSVSLHLYTHQKIYPLNIQLSLPWRKNQTLFSQSSDKSTCLSLRFKQPEERLKQMIGKENILQMECQSHLKRDMLIYLCVRNIFNKPDAKTVQTPQASSNFENEVQDLFTEREDSFLAKTPEVGEGVIKDIGDVLYTPKKDFCSREKYFDNFDIFLNPPAKEVTQLTENSGFKKNDLKRSLSTDCANFNLSFSPSFLKNKLHQPNKFILNEEQECSKINQTEKKLQASAEKQKNVPRFDNMNWISKKSKKKVPDFLQSKQRRRERNSPPRFQTTKNLITLTFSPQKRQQLSDKLRFSQLKSLKGKMKKVKRLSQPEDNSPTMKRYRSMDQKLWRERFVLKNPLHTKNSSLLVIKRWEIQSKKC